MTSSLGRSVDDPTDPVGRLPFDVVGMVAELEGDFIRRRGPKLSTSHAKHLVSLRQAGFHTTTEIAELFSVVCSTVYRAMQRSGTTNV